MKKTVFFGLLVIVLVFGFIGCDNGTTSGNGNGKKDNNGEKMIKLTITNLPENGEAVIWLSTASQDDGFFQGLKAGAFATVSNNTGLFILKKPTADILGFTNENWTETGSFHFTVGFGKDGTQWQRSWSSPSAISIKDGDSISATGWIPNL